jgi:hypothetical protein
MYLPAGFVETASIEFIRACNEMNFEKIKQLKTSIDIDVCDNKGYTALIVSVVI